MMRRGICLIFILLLCTVFSMGFPTGAHADDKSSGDRYSFSLQGKDINGEIFVSIKDLSQSFGIPYKWDPTTKTVILDFPEMNVSSIINKVGPSVVGIIGKIKQESSKYNSRGDNLEFGTGVIYKPEGYIITNAHVVSDLESIVAVLSNGKSYMARLKAIDEKSDLAVVKIDKGGLTPVEFGDISDVFVGEPVVAIGTPLSFNLRNSATKGIVGGINRAVEGEYRFIQSDAAINAGNSGGPLVNMQGKVIGINSVKYTGFGVEGLNFSIPIDTVKYVISQFEKYGKVRRPYLGASFTEGIAARYGLPTDEGLTVTDIDKDSPAEKAKLQVDDIVISVNGVKINTIIDYNEEMKKYLPGDSVELTLKREDNYLKFKVTFGEAK